MLAVGGCFSLLFKEKVHFLIWKAICLRMYECDRWAFQVS